MKILQSIIFFLSFFLLIACNKNVAVEKDWNDAKYKNELKEKIKADSLFKVHLDIKKQIQVKAFLKKGVDFTSYDSATFYKSALAGKSLLESVKGSGANIDGDYIKLMEKSWSTYLNLIKKYPGTRFFTPNDWNDLMAAEMNDNFQKNISPYLKDIYKPIN